MGLELVGGGRAQGQGSQDANLPGGADDLLVEAERQVAGVRHRLQALAAQIGDLRRRLGDSSDSAVPFETPPA
jgi:hypothetical protein